MGANPVQSLKISSRRFSIHYIMPAVASIMLFFWQFWLFNIYHCKHISCYSSVHHSFFAENDQYSEMFLTTENERESEQQGHLNEWNRRWVYIKENQTGKVGSGSTASSFSSLFLLFCFFHGLGRSLFNLFLKIISQLQNYHLAYEQAPYSWIKTKTVQEA